MRRLALAQGCYYAATGIWPLLSRRTFEAVTGPKTDFWLVNTVGALVAVIGGALTVAGARGRGAPEVVLLGAGSALALAAVDVLYAAKGRISRVYLLDAVLEVGLAAGWLGVAAQARRSRAGNGDTRAVARAGSGSG